MMTLFLTLWLAHDTLKVTATTLNVRTGPGTTYAVVGEVHAGEIYVQMATSGSWRKIWFNDQMRWIHGSYVAVVDAAHMTVTAATLNVRSGPGAGYSIVGAAPKDSWWVVAASSGAWRKVYFGGAARWMHGDYLSTGAAAPPPPPVNAAGFIQLSASGPGFYAYSSGDRRWGLPSMVYGLQTAASGWKSAHPTYPRIGVGDISLEFGGPISGHVSHQVGKDVDIRPVRTDAEGPTTIFQSNYSSARTKDLITDHVKPTFNVNVIFFNDPAIEGPLGYVQPWPNHDNHFHLRINQ
jgi:uncharacterized protein YraI